MSTPAVTLETIGWVCLCATNRRGRVAFFNKLHAAQRGE